MNQEDTKFRKRRLGYNEIQKKQRRQEKRKESLGVGFRFFRNFGWKALLILVVAFAVIWQVRPQIHQLRHFSPSQLRHLKQIEINGNRMLVWEEIINAAGVEIGMSMSEINPDSIRKRLSKLPLIHQVNVKKSFPHSLLIQVEESGPLFTVFSEGKWNVYSDKATLMPMATSSAYQLPIVGASLSELEAVAEFLSALKEKDPLHYRNISQVILNTSRKEIEVNYRDVDYKTLFLIEKPSGELLKNYRKLTEGLSEELADVVVIDMRFPGFAYTKSIEKRRKDG